jgi:hypothetical protein
VSPGTFLNKFLKNTEGFYIHEQFLKRLYNTACNSSYEKLGTPYQPIKIKKFTEKNYVEYIALN